MNKVSDVLSYITEIAPLHWQENYDNSGLLIGDANALVDKALLTLDVTEKVIDEAIDNSCHLVISHHPLIFYGFSNNPTYCVIIKNILQAFKNQRMMTYDQMT